MENSLKGLLQSRLAIEARMGSIRKSIDDKVKEGKLKIHKMIGEDVGFKTKSGWEMNDREGVICNYEEI